VVTVTRDGWIKRVTLAEYRAQGRGGKGRNAMATKDEDAVTTLFVTSTHNPVLFFSSAGKVYRLKVWRLPQGSPQAKGKPINNLLPLAEGEAIITTLALPEDEAEWGRLHVMFATAHGYVRRNAMDAFTNVPTAGKLAIRFEDGDQDRLIGVALCDEADDCFLAARSGKAIRFPVTDVREFVSRTSTGVRGMTLAAGDEVVSMAILKGFEASTEEREDYLKAAPWKSEPGERVLSETRMAQFAAAEEFILTITANGYGKRSSAFEYRRSGRGGQGIRNIAESDRNGDVVASFTAHDDDDIMLVTDQAKLIRIRAADIRIMGRSTNGVTLFKVAEDEHVVSAALIPADGEGDAEGDGGKGEGAPAQA
jgi:DNA gyrase subunit A